MGEIDVVDVKDPYYKAGYVHNRRVWMVDPNGVATVVTVEEWRKIRGEKGFTIKHRGQSVKMEVENETERP